MEPGQTSCLSRFYFGSIMYNFMPNSISSLVWRSSREISAISQMRFMRCSMVL